MTYYSGVYPIQGGAKTPTAPFFIKLLQEGSNKLVLQ